MQFAYSSFCGGGLWMFASDHPQDFRFSLGSDNLLSNIFITLRNLLWALACDLCSPIYLTTKIIVVQSTTFVVKVDGYYHQSHSVRQLSEIFTVF